MARMQKLIVAIGKKGVGKTWETNNMIYEYNRGSTIAAGRRALIHDVNDEFSHVPSLPLEYVKMFSAHPKKDIRRIRPFHKNGKKHSLDDTAATLNTILNEYRGGMLLVEDINKYTSDNMPNDVIGAICTNRHADLDIIIHYQSIGRISPKVWQNVNCIRFHKITDSVAKHKNKFEDKFEMMSVAECIVNRQYEINPRFSLWIDIDENKIRANRVPLTQDIINAAVDEYIENNYKQTVGPLLKVQNNAGKKYTPDSAYNHVKNTILKKYF